MSLPGPGGRLGLAAAVLMVLPLLVGLDDYRISVLTGALLVGLLAQSWNLMAGIGLISLGHAAFFGVGAYAAAVARVGGLGTVTALFLGGGLALLFSILFIALAGRLRGAYFALATLVAAAIPKAVALRWEKVTGGASGLMGIPAFKAGDGRLFELSGARLGEYYSLLAAVAWLSVTLWWLRHRSRFGPASSALRQDETASRSLGISPLPYRAAAILVSSFFAGIGGGFFALQVRYLEPHYLFGLHFSIVPLVASVFGGLSTMWGPFIGAMALHVVNEFVFRRFLLTGHDVLYGLMLTTAVLFFPGGLTGRLRKAGGKGLAER